MFSKEELERIKNRRVEWEKNTLAKFVERGERKEEFKTPSGIPLKHVYSPEDIEKLDYVEDIGFPGTEPFTRGVYPTMYRGRFWTMRQYSGFADAIKTNERFKYLISQGQKGLSIAFDLPTQMGYDSNNVLCIGEVGRVGVTINSLKDLELVFDGISLENVSTSMTINAPTAILLAMYIAVGEKQGIKPEILTGTVQNDILKEYIARGTYIFPPNPSLRLITDVIEYCTLNLPRFNSISISGYHMREAGANAIQEIAFTISNGIAYVDEIIKRGIDVDDFAPRLSFFFTIQNHFFEEIAKLRAARRIWYKIMKERFNAKNENSLKLRFHSQTAGISLTAQQPNVNIIRVAIQALAAVLGGTQSLHTCGADEALSIPTEESATLSLRTQQVIAHETGASDVVDPLGGSYYIEYLTSQLEKEAMKYIKKIDEMGGMTTAIENTFIQQEIQNNAYLYQKNVEDRSEKVVGVNIFRSDEKLNYGTFQLDKKFEDRIIKSLQELKEQRNNDLLKEKLEELKRVASSNENIMPVMIEVVKSYATIQEISDVLREVFGEYQGSQIF